MGPDEGGGRPVADDPAGRDDRHAVTEPLRLVHVVGREEHGRALPLQLAHPRPEREPHRRIEAGRGLVEHEELGLVHERQRDGQPAPEAAGEHLHRHPGVRAQLEEVEQLLDALREDGLAQQMVAAEDTQVVDRRDRVDEHVLLERDADARPDRAGLTGDVEPEDADRPRGRPGDAVDHAEGRGLPGPVRPEETEAPTPRDFRANRAWARSPPVAARGPDCLLCGPRCQVPFVVRTRSPRRADSASLASPGNCFSTPARWALRSTCERSGPRTTFYPWWPGVSAATHLIPYAPNGACEALASDPI